MAVAGRVAIVPKGNFDKNTQYERLDMVLYNGNGYVAKKTSSGILPTNEEYWMKSTEGTAVGFATAEAAGIVKPDGETTTVDENGTLHAVSLTPDLSAASLPYSNIYDTETTKDVIESLKTDIEDIEVPTKVSELTNDSGYQTAENVQDAIADIEIPDSPPIESVSVNGEAVEPDSEKNVDITVPWKPNTAESEGYVLAGSGHPNQVWKTDEDGNPAWRDESGSGGSSGSSDYEEGEWTASYSVQGPNTNNGQMSKKGVYVKMGRLVWIYVFLPGPGNNAYDMITNVSGFPFPIDIVNTQGGYGLNSIYDCTTAWSSETNPLYDKNVLRAYANSNNSLSIQSYGHGSHTIFGWYLTTLV